MGELTFGNILGGVNYTIPPNELPKGFLADASNIVPVLSGYGSPRNGSSVLNTSAESKKITSFHEFVKGGSSNKFAAHGQVVGKYNSSTGTFDDHITGLTDGRFGQWWNYGDYAIYVNGTDNAKRTDGTTAADLTADMGGLTGAGSVCEWGERVWIGGYTGNEATLVGSALRAATDFSTATADIGYYSGTVGNKESAITLVFPFFDILLIGKLNQIYQLTGAPETASSTFRLTPVQTKDGDSFGFTSKNAVALVGNDVLFLDGFNIKAMSGVNRYGDIEALSVIGNIKDYFRDPSGAGLDKGLLQNTHFFHYKYMEQIHVSVPTGVLERYWFVIDYSNQDIREQKGLPRYSFYPMSAGFVPMCFGGVKDGSRVNIYAGCDDGYVRRLDVGTNDGLTAVDSYMTFCFGHESRNIQPKYVNLNVKYNGSLSLSPYYAVGLTSWEDMIDSANFTALSSEDVTDSSWRSNNDTAYKRISGMMYNTGKSFAFKLRHNTAGETYQMRQSALGYTAKHRYAG